MEDEKLDRMAKARAAKKPPKYKNIHEDVKNLPDDNVLSLKNVKEWEQHNKERVKELKYKIRRMDKGKEKTLLERELENRKVYLMNIARYFDTSAWLDLFYGKDQEHKTRYRTIAHAYDENGYIKVNYASITD
ncbi:MAG: hypothetical protein EX285_08955 [Thaumarchaeota archaeon]|nr:hypothetical protein [Nitrososphaerota archaeon]